MRVGAFLRRVASASASPTSTQPPPSATASHGRLPDDALSVRLVAIASGGYKLLPPRDRFGVLVVVAEDLRPFAADLQEAAVRLLGATDNLEGGAAGGTPAQASVSWERLRYADRAASISLSPFYTTLLTRLVAAPGGLAFLINLRAGIISTPRDAPTPPPRPFFTEVTAALRMWLSAGSLSLTAVTPSSPATLLQRLASVSSASSPQPVRAGTEGLYARLQNTRICANALMHAGM